MATPAQITANRVNAQSSTGPRSVEGKAASSRNSFKSGLYSKSLVIPGEDPAELELLTSQYMDEFEPDNVVEHRLVQTLVRSDWIQQRCDRLEAACLTACVAAQPEGTENALGKAVIEDAITGDVLTKIFRRREAAAREFNRTLSTLSQILAARRRHAAQQRAAQRPDTPPPADRVRFSSPSRLDISQAAMSDEDFLNLALRL